MIAGNEVPFLDDGKATITRTGDYFTVDTTNKCPVNKAPEVREVHVSNVRWAEPMPQVEAKAKKG